MSAALRQNVIIEGRPLLTAIRAARWLGHCALRVPATVAIGRGGPRMRLAPYLRHYGSTSLFMKRLEYEPTLRFLATVVGDTDVVFDVGANFGVYSLVLAQRAARVFAFEPGTEALAQLRKNVALNPELNVEVVPLGLSSREGRASLAHIGGPPTYSVSDKIGGEPISVTTLDAWASDAGEREPTLIKVDVEGHEPAVFAGGRTTLELARPLVMFEVSFEALRRSDFSETASWDELAGLGYRFFRLRPDGRLRELDRVEEDNLFAVHPDSGWTDRLRRVM
jgi:FkbM family methyltransferase